MEVTNNVNKMRLSPVLVAVLAASATLGLSSPAKGKAPESSSLNVDVTQELGIVDHANAHTVAEQPRANAATLLADGDLVQTLDAVPAQWVVPTVSEPESAIAPIFAQAPTETVPADEGTTDSPILAPVPETPPAPGSPPPGTATPADETPDEIQFDLTPDGTTDAPIQDSPAPELELDTPETEDTSPVLPAPTQGDPAQETQAAPVAEPRVLVAERAVQVEGDAQQLVTYEGQEQTLEQVVYDAVQTQPGRTTTRSQIQEDINAVFATGFFSSVRAVPEDTPLGVRVTYIVEPNPVLQAVRLEGNQVLAQAVVDEIFQEQYGSILNLRRFQEGVKELNEWYQKNGYVLAQVVDAPQVAEDGTVTLIVAEGVIEDIQVQFLNKEGELTNEEGEPVRGRTRDFIVTREFSLKPGDVFNRAQAEADLQRVFRLGIFEDVRLSLNPGQDPRKVVVVANVIERRTGSIGAAAGISSASGLFGSVSYQEQNLGGNNQRLGAEVQVGERELLFDVNFTDPWIAGDPYRTSYTVNVFNRRSISLIFDGGDRDVDLPNGDRPRIDRLGGGLSFTRPLSKDVFSPAEWTASLGLQYQRVSIRDSDREISPVDELGNQLSFDGDGTDDLVTLQFGVVRDRRNNALRPTSGSFLRLGTEQSIPVGDGSIFFNRLRGSYSRYIPVNFTNFSEGAEALAFNVQAGTVIGDLPPYEAFSLGGSNSVRGYDDGDVGSGRSFIQATAEYRFPIFSVIGGALFVDFASDLGTGDNVIGDPAGVRGKPGSGFGYGIGVRVQSPLGPIRVDFGFNDDGENRLHFGIGERF